MTTNTILDCVKEIVTQIGQHQSIHDILANLDSGYLLPIHFSISYVYNLFLLELPGTIHRTYIDQASYWLTYFP